MPVIIGLSGKMGTGKTTLANMLCEAIPGAVRMSFADAVREEVAKHFGFPIDYVCSQGFKQHHHQVGGIVMSGRELLQWWGTGVRRKADPHYWTDEMVNRIAVSMESVIIIDDVRFEDELAVVRGHRGHHFRLMPHEQWQAGPNANHASETDLDLLAWAMGDEGELLRPAFGFLGACVPVVLDKVGEVAR